MDPITHPGSSKSHENTKNVERILEAIHKLMDAFMEAGLEPPAEISVKNERDAWALKSMLALWIGETNNYTIARTMELGPHRSSDELQIGTVMGVKLTRPPLQKL